MSPVLKANRGRGTCGLDEVQDREALSGEGQDGVR